MVCPYCASSNIITIQGQGYCVNCGHSLDINAAKTKALKPSGKTESKQTLKPIIQAATKPTIKIEASSKSSVKPVAKLAPTISKHSTTNNLSEPVKKPTSAPATGPLHMNDLSPAKPKSTTKPLKPAITAATVAIKPMVAPTPKAKLPEPKPKSPRVKRSTKRRLAADQRQQSRPPKPSRRAASAFSYSFFSGLVASALASISYLTIRASHASSMGNFFHILATSGAHAKIMGAALAPIVFVILAGLGIVWLWLGASTGYASSKRYDNRPIGASVAYRAGFNATADVVGFTFLGLLSGLVWLSVLVLAIKYLGHLSLVYWQLAALGVAASFVLVLVGLWLLAGFTLATYIAVLSGQSFGKSLAQGFTLAHKDYAYAAGTGLGLVIILGTIKIVTVFAYVGFDHLLPRAPSWLIAMLGAVVIGLLIGWYVELALEHWLRRYRIAAIRVFGQDKSALYLAGRHPRPMKPKAVAIVVVWWLGVAIASAWILWHFQVNPTSLLNKLALNIY